METQSKYDLTEKNDDDIIIEAQKGSTVAFDELVRRYRQRVYAVAYQMTKDPEDADDLAQEAFIRAYEAIGRFQVGMKFYTWIYRIVVNLGINMYKKKSRSSNLSPEQESQIPARVKSNPAVVIENQELGETIREALQKLPPHQKSVFALRVFQDLSYKEIAETLEISIGTVMSRLNRAREALKNELQDYVKL